MISISILVNGTTHNVAAGTTLDQLLATTLDSSDRDACASAVNGAYVARQARASHVLEDHDEVTTFEPITGG